MIVKEKMHFVGSLPRIKEGEIWWYAAGENVGVEINGKNDTFSRPILILKKFGALSFLGIPLSTKEHTGSWYADFIFNNQKITAALSQIRLVGTSRLYNKMGQIPENDFVKVKTALHELLFG